MSARRHTSICREGWYYCVVLAFVLGGAVLREVNLLILMAGLMVGPLLFSWRWVMAMLRDLQLRRSFPPIVGAGEPFSIEITVSNLRRRLGSWALVIEDRLQSKSVGATPEKVLAELYAPQVEPQTSVTLRYRCLLPRRGRYEFGSTTIATHFPFGFVRGYITQKLPGSLVVCPQLGQLTAAWYALVAPRRIGTHMPHRQRGRAEGNYFGLREWRQGDSQRWIHWRTTAKRGELSVLEFEQHRDLELAILVDLWLPEKPTERARGGVELAVSFAGTVVADICRQSGNRLLLAVAGKKYNCWSASSSQVFGRDLLKELAEVQSGNSTAFGRDLATSIAQFSREPRVIVISTRPRHAELCDQLLKPFGTREGLRWEGEAPAEPHTAVSGGGSAGASPSPAATARRQANIVWLDVSANGVEEYFRV